jgi:DNA-binding phage protein|tara:strand:- start:620 stop:880 length:261 start_codon:yes stop_codon:yes gene_type:complete
MNFRYKHHLDYPDQADPIIRKVVELTNKSKMNSAQVCKKAEIGINSITGWKTNYGTGQRNPSLHNIQAVLKVLGYKLVVRKRSSLD